MQKPDALIYQYLKKYQEDPSSRIFAPLAEAYRKSGRVHEAIEIAREGLEHHPRFIGGRVALARCLFDLKDHAAVVTELEPIIRDAPDNLVAQRLLAESYLVLGRTAEALAAYKMLLYFSPSDLETAQLVKELETQAYEQGALVVQTDPVVTQWSTSAHPTPPAVVGPDWVQRVEKLQSLLIRVVSHKARQQSLSSRG